MTIPSELTGAGHAFEQRAGDPQRDSIDGVVPDLVLEPETPAAVAAALAWAAERGLSVLIQGSGTKRAWGRRPDRLDAILSMRKLNRLITHRHGDLTVTVEAGITIRELNETLSTHGQRLPLDPPFADRATIGGLLAANDSGPIRHRFGTPRDLVIGVQLATTDGRLTHAGGQVVKNVAGYDLSRLVCGSFGMLAAIVSATFKLSPVPAVSRTLVINPGVTARMPAIVSAISASQLEPLAFELRVRRSRSGAGDEANCLVRFGSIASAVDEQVQEAARHVTASGGSCDVLSGDAEARVWEAHDVQTTGHGEAVVRVSWLPADLPGVVTLVEQLASEVDVEMIGRAGVGAGLIRIGGDARQQAAAVEHLRQSPIVGHVVVTSATTELKALVDVWGPSRNPQLLEAIKRALDPSGTLGAGRA